jgi:hypothetical protein
VHTLPLLRAQQRNQWHNIVAEYKANFTLILFEIVYRLRSMKISPSFRIWQFYPRKTCLRFCKIFDNFILSRFYCTVCYLLLHGSLIKVCSFDRAILPWGRKPGQQKPMLSAENANDYTADMISSFYSSNLFQRISQLSYSQDILTLQTFIFLEKRKAGSFVISL